MPKSVFLAASWFLFLIALLVGLLTFPVRTWNEGVVSTSTLMSPQQSDSSPPPLPRLPRAGVSR